MFPTTITINNISDLQKVMSVLYPTTAVVEVTDKSRDVAKADKPGNGKPAASQPAATAAAKTEAATASPSDAGKPAASTAPTSPSVEVVAADAPVLTYADVAKVATVLAGKDRAAAVAIAGELGVANFKALNDLPEEERPAAFVRAVELVNAKLAELGASDV